MTCQKKLSLELEDMNRGLDHLLETHHLDDAAQRHEAEEVLLHGEVAGHQVRAEHTELVAVAATADAEELDQATDKTWVVSGQSPDQKELLAALEEKSAVYVEGAFRLWLDNYQVGI